MDHLSRIDEIYNEFQNFPAKGPVVRNNQKNDCYSIFVLETLFSPYHGIRKFQHSDKEHRAVLEKAIVPPPDDHIDIFYEEVDFDERIYHVVQVKNTHLGATEIETCLTMMEQSVTTYIKNPKTLKRNLRDVMSGTEFSKEDKKNCIYYVVHAGRINAIRNQKPNQFIHTFAELQMIREGVEKECVPRDTITIDTVNNFIVNNFIKEEKSHGEQTPGTDRPRSLLCNFNGYDLAKLNNKYASSLAGRNILYGQNLRESLKEKSKTFGSMFDTINTEPDLFLFYNNGITILCSDVDAKSERQKENITLKDFSIINGAQTTSTLGAFLKQAEIEEDAQKIEKLKRVFVLTKIYEINSELKEHEKISENIRVFTNTQTPLSNRDMVSIRSEQVKAQRRFIEDFDAPNAFILIKKGESPRDYPKLLPYQVITNERVAQLCFAGPLLDPFTAKDKRSKLFNVDQQEGVTLNALYHQIYDAKDGLIFKLSNIELDELLFVYKLHEDSKLHYRRGLKAQLDRLNQEQLGDDVDKRTREQRKEQVKRFIEIAAVCIFHNITGYYLMKKSFELSKDESSQRIFDTRRYYNDKDYRTQVIELFLDVFLTKTIEIIADNSGIGNIQNWTRSMEGSNIFKEKFQAELIRMEYKLAGEYKKFVKLAKV